MATRPRPPRWRGSASRRRWFGASTSWLAQAPDLIKALGKANDSLRGAGSVADMREASDERLRVVRELVDRAAELLDEAGLGAAESTRERMARTLLATASDPSAEEALRDRQAHRRAWSFRGLARSR